MNTSSFQEHSGELSFEFPDFSKSMNEARTTNSDAGDFGDPRSDDNPRPSRTSREKKSKEKGKKSKDTKKKSKEKKKKLKKSQAPSRNSWAETRRGRNMMI